MTPRYVWCLFSVWVEPTQEHMIHVFESRVAAEEHIAQYPPVQGNKNSYRIERYEVQRRTA